MRQEYKEKQELILNRRKLLVVFLMLLTVCLYSGSKIIIRFIEEKQENTQTYTNKGIISYNVSIDTNLFITDTTLDSGRSYITSLVNGLNMTFDYEYGSEVELPLTYDYSIKATLYGLYNQDPTSTSNPVIWNKEYVIKEATGELTYTGKNLSIKEDFSLDIRSYIYEILAFIENFQISTIGYIEIEMPINVHGSTDKYSISSVYDLTAKISIEDKVFMISGTDAKETTNYVTVNETPKESVSLRELTLYVISFITSLVLVLITIRKMSEYSDSETYNEKLEKLKVDYSEVIIVTNSMIDIKHFRIISIISFDELLNLAANLSSPIMLYEGKREAIFYILKDDIIYLYVYRNKEYKKKN